MTAAQVDSQASTAGERPGRLAYALAWAANTRRGLALLLGVALLVRLPGLIEKPLWYDEAFSVLFASKGLRAMLQGSISAQSSLASDVHPPLYYAVLSGWQLIFGEGPASARMLSVLLGMGVLTVASLLAQRLFGGRLGLVAGWLLALSPFQVHYAQEVRMYVLLALLLLTASYFYWDMLDSARRWSWVGFGLCAALAQYTHNLAVLYLLPLSATGLFLRDWRVLRQTAAGGLLALAIYSPWLVTLIAQLASIERSYWIPPPGAESVIRTLLVYVTGLPLPAWSLPIALFSAIFVLLTASIGTYQALRRRQKAGWRGAWLAYLALAPILFMLLASLWRPVYLDRALLPAGAAFLLWIAWALARSPLTRWPALRWTAVGILAANLLFGLVSFYTYRGFPYAPFREALDEIDQQRGPGEVVLHSNKLTALPSFYYAPGIPQHYLRDAPLSGSDTLHPATQRVLGHLASESVDRVVAGAEGVWLLIFERELEEYQQQGTAEHPVLVELGAEFHLESSTAWGELQVRHYVDSQRNDDKP